MLELRAAYPFSGSKIGRRREKGKRKHKAGGEKKGNLGVHMEECYASSLCPITAIPFQADLTQ